MSLINNIVFEALKPALKHFDKGQKDPVATQMRLLAYLTECGRQTAFGIDHDFGSIRTYEDFRKHVPVREYDELAPYIERLRRGEDYVLWNERTKYFARSSGTSSDKSKYIPITPSALSKCHFRGFMTTLGTYMRNNPGTRIFNGRSLTLGGSVRLDELSSKGAVNGDLSAVLLHNSPRVAEIVRTPRRSTAMIPSFEEKIEGICRECSKQNVTNFSGVPSWNLIMIEKLLEYNNAQYLTDIWPNIELFMHGGISFDPYREQYRKLIPSDRMHYLENYNASEGFFAVQDDLNDRGMALTMDNGVFYEFIPLASLQDVLSGSSDDVCTIEGVRTGVVYAIVITTNSGLWRYLIGDCVEFTSTYPHKIIIKGRTKLFINAFGEELMIHNAESALKEACGELGLQVSDYTVAPIFMDGHHSKGAHEWVVEFSGDSAAKCAGQPELTVQFRHALDAALCRHNSDYEAKRAGDVTMTELELKVVPPGTFYKWMESRGKAGGQNKVPRLSPERRFVEEILQIN